MVGPVRSQVPGVSIRASRAGGDASDPRSPGPPFEVFQSAPPAREATFVGWIVHGFMNCFNPRLPRGRRQFSHLWAGTRAQFQSAPPAREATTKLAREYAAAEVSIRASRAGGDVRGVPAVGRTQVSIRASRAGGDQGTSVAVGGSPVVSIRASRAGGDCGWPARRTRTSSFNPRLPRGRRPDLIRARAPAPEVSIRASRAGGDEVRVVFIGGLACFNPRLPRGRRRRLDGRASWRRRVSIRASRAGGDYEVRRRGRLLKVSIRASRAGGDPRKSSMPYSSNCFNPRLPRGRRQRACRSRRAVPSFNPRLPRGRRPPAPGGGHGRQGFNPRLPRGRRPRSADS